MVTKTGIGAPALREATEAAKKADRDGLLFSDLRNGVIHVRLDEVEPRGMMLIHLGDFVSEGGQTKKFCIWQKIS